MSSPNMIENINNLRKALQATFLAFYNFSTIKANSDPEGILELVSPYSIIKS